MKEENSDFLAVCRDAISQMKKHRTAYVFSTDQVNYIKSQKGFENIKVRDDDGIFYLTLVK
jgi:hypothetical protein